MTDLIDKYCQATQIIVDKAISELAFDKTVIATIVDTSSANIGEYTVSENGATYLAYNENTNFQNGDVVYVNIPQNDYSKQKFIIGKYYADTESAASDSLYNSFLNITGNLIDEDEKIQGKLIANHIDLDKREVLLTTQNFTENNVLDYSRLYIAADIKTGLSSWKIKDGEYGIRVDITTHDSSDIHSLYFSCYTMFGNVYQFTTYSKQQVVFDISAYKNLKQISIYFYQKSSSFIDTNNNLIPYKDELNYDLGFNLLLNNLILSFGYDKSELEVGVDKLIAYTFSDKVYNKASEEEYNRIINLSWIHWENDIPIVIQNNADIEIEFNIKWYQYRLQSQALIDLTNDYNNISGIFLTTEVENYQAEKASIEQQFAAGTITEVQSKTLIDEIDNNIKTIIDQIYKEQSSILTDDIYLNSNWEYQPAYHNSFIYYFLPKQNRESEQIQALIITYDAEGNEKVLYSNILIFNNANPVIPTNSLSSGVQIICDDGMDGKYFIYDQNNSIINQEESYKTRYLEVDLIQNNGINSSLLTGDYEIKWIYPEDTSNNMFEIVKDDNSRFLAFKIKENYTSWQSENTISCEIIKDKETFCASYNLLFGQIGRNGSDATLIINLKNNYNTTKKYYKQAIIANTQDSLSFELNLIDSEGKKIILDSTNYVVNWYLNDSNVSLGTGYTFTFNTPAAGYSINSILILKAVLTGYTDYPLITYYAIPITADIEEYNYLTGITEVVYTNMGYPLSYTKPYELYDYEHNLVDNLKWNTFNNNQNAAYRGEISLETNTLQPLSLYVEGAPPYSVQAKNRTNNAVVWNQPILVVQNTFGSTTINEWDGKSLVLNEDEGSIVATSIAAGHKNEQDLFSGVIMGEWADAQETPSTGLYGFLNGEASFGFRETGTAFLGTSSSGRILFDGINSTIQSAGYDLGEGIFIDLNDAIQEFLNISYEQQNTFKASNVGKYYQLVNGQYELANPQPTASNFNESIYYKRTGYCIRLDASDANKPLNSYALRIGDPDNPAFTVNWKGEIRATAGRIGQWVISTAGLGDVNNNIVFNPELGLSVFSSDTNASTIIGADGILQATNVQIKKVLQFDDSKDTVINNLIRIKTYSTKNTFSMGKTTYTKTITDTVNLEGYYLYAIRAISTNKPTYLSIRSFDLNDNGSFSITISKYPAEVALTDIKVFAELAYIRKSGQTISSPIASESFSVTDSDVEYDENGQPTQIPIVPEVYSNIYLTQNDAANIYLTQNNASNTYLTQNNANDTYLKKTTANNTYLKIADAEEDYAAKTDLSSYLKKTVAADTYFTNESAGTYKNKINEIIEALQNYTYITIEKL